MNSINLSPNMRSINIHESLEILRKGNVIAIPTETVYGLGGWIHSEEGIKNIFKVKERPFFDPLIVHVDSLQKAQDLALEWTDAHQVLAEHCWPGPITLIAKKKKTLNPLITSGLDSVGIRCPRHPLTLSLLSQLEGGIAAPSANKFGKTSPTRAHHVFEEFNNIVPVLDGGPAEVGIESTVVGIEGKEVKIFRPGYFTAKMLTQILKSHGLNLEVTYSQSPVAPGQLKHHYMPKIPLIIYSQEIDLSEVQKYTKNKLTFKNPVFWKQPLDPVLASRELYEKMRTFDSLGFDIIFAEKSHYHDQEEWFGIWNRLDKAKTFSVTLSFT